MLTTSTSMPWPSIFVANISDSKALGVRDHVRNGHIRREPCQKGATLGGGKMLASSTSMPWPKTSVANISDNKALGVRIHVRRGGGAVIVYDNLDKFYINAMAKDICCNASTLFQCFEGGVASDTLGMMR